MSLSFFDNKAITPCEDSLAAALGESLVHWQAIKAQAASYKDPVEEWKHYGQKAGWCFLLKSGKRTLITLIPLEGFFQACFAFGERTTEVALAADLPEDVKEIVREGQICIGRSFRFDIKEGGAVLDSVLKLLEIKYEN